MSSRIRFVSALVLSTIVAGVFFYLGPWLRFSQVESLFENDRQERKEDFESKWNQEFLMLRDPKANHIPKNIFQKELTYAGRLLEVQERTLGKRAAFTWIER